MALARYDTDTPSPIASIGTSTSDTGGAVPSAATAALQASKCGAGYTVAADRDLILVADDVLTQAVSALGRASVDIARVEDDISLSLGLKTAVPPSPASDDRYDDPILLLACIYTSY